MPQPGRTVTLSAVVLETDQNHYQHFSFGKSFEVFKLDEGRPSLRRAMTLRLRGKDAKILGNAG
jgi:hypothetical protein